MQADFDEDFYLASNPDIAEAVRSGAWPHGFAHYLAHGQAEGRRPCADFDAEWYARAYPAARMETDPGDAAALERHYRERGRYRGYLPNPRAARPRNAAAMRSPFGGLWIAAANALDLIDGRRKLGLIDPEEAALLADFVRDGYVVLPKPVPPELLDPLEQVVEAAYRGDLPWLRFECHAISRGLTYWQPGMSAHPAKAIDLHWAFDAVRNAIFCPEILRFLHRLFERPVLAEQTLAFYRGSQQQIHQDSAYLAYSLPLQFAATWIALEDVEAETGELEYFVESHRELPDFLYGAAHKSVCEAQRLGTGNNSLTDEIEQHLQAIQREAATRNLVKRRFLARRGEVLVWHAELAHGGSPTASSRTRKSLVTHYCPSEVAPLSFEGGACVLKQHPSGSFYTSSLYTDDPDDPDVAVR